MLQPSFSETSNNVTAEGAAGVPSVVSNAIGWAPKNWRARADSAKSNAAVGATLIRDRFAADNGWRALDAHNNAAAKQWSGWLSAQGYDYFAWASSCW